MFSADIGTKQIIFFTMFTKEQYMKPFAGKADMSMYKLETFKLLRERDHLRSFKLRDKENPNEVIDRFQGRVIGFDLANALNIEVVIHKVVLRDESGTPLYGKPLHSPLHLVDLDVLQASENETPLSPEK